MSDKEEELTLKDRVEKLDLVAETSDTIYFRGISPKLISDDQVFVLLSLIEPPIEYDAAERRSAGSGSVWAKYNSVETARLTIAKMHELQFQGYFRGCGLMCSFELGPVTRAEGSGKCRVTQAEGSSKCVESDKFLPGSAPKAGPNANRLPQQFQRRKSSVCYNPVLRRICDLQRKPLADYAEWAGQRQQGALKSAKITNNFGVIGSQKTNRLAAVTEEDLAANLESPVNEGDNSVRNPHKLNKRDKKLVKKAAREAHQAGLGEKLAISKAADSVLPEVPDLSVVHKEVEEAADSVISPKQVLVTPPKPTKKIKGPQDQAQAPGDGDHRAVQVGISAHRRHGTGRRGEHKQNQSKKCSGRRKKSN